MNGKTPHEDIFALANITPATSPADSKKKDAKR
jgi:hypothetical protein